MITENQELSSYNTFGIHVKADKFSTFSSVEELRSILESNKNIPLLVLGGGSNVLFTKDFNGLVLLNQIKGFEVIEENSDYAIVKSGSGEIWHQFVLNCIDHGFGGLENLSLIPGSVGASPMQNIGAYGVEIKDVFHSLTAFHIETGELHEFNKEACEFGYRESVFKRKLKGQYIITDVSFKLSKKPSINSSYGAIENQLKEMGIESPTIKDISNAVIEIRRSKLPDPSQIGNAGSFFKNPVVDSDIAETILNKYPGAPVYPADGNKKKLAAGWLIEKAGWKGKTIDNFGVHKLQALVLVNYGGATGKQIYDLSAQIIEDIQQKFGVTLEREVNIL
jgi:UDP-N-acetylmuramate dehydrogenase